MVRFAISMQNALARFVAPSWVGLYLTLGLLHSWCEISLYVKMAAGLKTRLPNWHAGRAICQNGIPYFLKKCA